MGYDFGDVMPRDSLRFGGIRVLGIGGGGVTNQVRLRQSGGENSPFGELRLLPEPSHWLRDWRTWALWASLVGVGFAALGAKIHQDMRPRRVPKVPTETTLDLNDPQDLGKRLTQIFSEFDVRIEGYNPHDKDSNKPRFIISHKRIHTSWNNLTTVVDRPCENMLLIHFKIDGGRLRFVTAQVLQSLTLGVGALPIDVKDKSPEWLEQNAAALSRLLELIKNDKQFPWGSLYAAPDPSGQAILTYDSYGNLQGLTYPNGRISPLAIAKDQ